MEAAKYFKQFLRESTTASPQQKKDAESGLAEVRQKLGQIQVNAPTGSEITLDDGERIGTAPLSEPIDVEPGPHTIKSPTDSVKVIATVGQKVEARLGATASPPAVVPVTPTPSTSTPGTPPASTPPPGSGTDGNAGATKPPPSGGDTGARKTNLLDLPETMWPVYAGLAVGVAGLASTIVFAAFKADAQSKADAVANDIRRAASLRGISSQGVCSSSNAQIQKDFGNACKTLRDNNDKVDTNATIANVSIVVMAVGFATAAGWFLFSPKRTDDSKSADATKKIPERKAQTPVLTPYGGWNSAGLTWSGEF